MSSARSQHAVLLMSHDCRWTRLVVRFTVAVSCVVAFGSLSYGQSTFGTVLGTVKDPSGSLVPTAKVDLLNTGTSATRSTVTGADGAYQFVNVEVGNYKLQVEAPGFQVTEYQPFDLAARATVRVDVDLKVASQATTVNVEAVSIVQTDASNVAETKGSLELTNLPVAIGTRSSGSTSAFSTLTAQPGVQIDDSNNITVAGALPSQLSVTVDGISSVGPGTLGALAELFPSFNAIEEIKISETLNPAEYGGVADITTVSKSGTNEFHGGLFENVQNTNFNASDTFSHLQTPVKLNNFGIYLGGPIIIPKLYNGRNKTFFFGSYEVLRLPKSLTSVLSVPTQAMRNGDLSAYLDPSQGGSDNLLTGYPGNVIPKSQLSPYAQKLLDFIYPLPNYGAPGDVANNYLASYAIPINSAQGDIRVDQSLGPKHLIYVRYTYKNRRITDAQRDGYGPSSNPSSPLLGGVSRPEIYNSLATSYNWVISPTVVNELRGGFSVIHRDVTYGITSQEAADLLGLTVGPGALPGPLPPGSDIPTLAIQGFMGIQGQANDTNPHEGTYQITDSLTWTKGKHTLKFGGDWRYLSSLNTQVFNNYRMGSYTFNGSALGDLLGGGSATPIASFLLGYPDLTAIGTVINPNTDAYAKHYAVFAQDDWKVSQSLTINFGLRWEYHPGFRDKNADVVNFDPYYNNVVDGQNTGAVILPSQAAFANINPGFVQSVAPTPIILASQAGIPGNLRFSSKKDFAPRVGFAYRIGGSNKTVLRGGYGRFIESLLSGTAINGWSVGASDIGYFSNELGSDGNPIYKFPYSYPADIAQPGSQFFDLASEIKYKDPIVEEWNLTLERDLGKGIGIRLSYDGNHSYHIPTLVNSDQVRANTLGFSDPAVQATIPFPLMSYIATGTTLNGFGNYNAGTISVHKRGANLQFELSYTYTRNLTNVNGAPTNVGAGAFVNEFGNTLSDPYNPNLDYGNTPFSRRNRVLATFLYELPFGKGRTFLNSSNGVLDRIVGGWELSGVALFQTGPFMSVSTLGDPSGTGYNLFNYNGGRADTVQGVDPYAGQSISQWVNPNAFVDPPDNIGRFGNSQSGAVTGPGTQAVSLSLIKRIAFTERIRMEVGMQVSNAFNHPNYAPPGDLTLTDPGFGQVTSLQAAEGAGPRQIQLTARITF
jgi:Carboxypeptidase regulatory-like domain/TonB dependent receptor-like, beta-barrel